MKLYSLTMAFSKYCDIDKKIYFINTKQYTQEEFRKLVEEIARNYRDNETKTWNDVFDKIVHVLGCIYGFIEIDEPCEMFVESSCEIPRLNMKGK
jgi:hypothetical protein